MGQPHRLEQVKKDAVVKREMSVGDIVDYRMLREVSAEMEKR